MAARVTKTCGLISKCRHSDFRVVGLKRSVCLLFSLRALGLSRVDHLRDGRDAGIFVKLAILHSLNAISIGSKSKAEICLRHTQMTYQN